MERASKDDADSRHGVLNCRVCGEYGNANGKNYCKQIVVTVTSRSAVCLTYRAISDIAICPLWCPLRKEQMLAEVWA